MTDLDDSAARNGPKGTHPDPDPGPDLAGLDDADRDFGGEGAEEWEEVDPLPPERLAAAGVRLIEQATEVADELGAGPGLLEILERLGRLSAYCTEEAGILAFNDAPRTAGEREYQAGREREFIRFCADELARVAGLSLGFSFHLLRGLDPDGDNLVGVVGDIRAELMTELGILGARSVYPLEVTKREIGNAVQFTLHSAAFSLAQAAHDLAGSRYPGQAAVTMTELAAELLHTGLLIAEATDHPSWPDLGDDTY